LLASYGSHALSHRLQDDNYTAQRALVEADAAFYCVELLDDDSPAVAIRAAATIARLCDHSSSAKARLQAGHSTALEGGLCRIALNPVQDSFIEAGAINHLVPWLTQGSELKKEAALEALTMLCSFNHDGKVLYLDVLVELLEKGEVHALGYCEPLLETLDCQKEDVSMVLDRLAVPLRRCLATSSEGTAVELSALGVLGTLCEKCSEELRVELRACETIIEGSLRALLQGSLPVRDVAARALWCLTQGDSSLMEKSASDVANALYDLIRSSKEAEEARDKLEDQQRSEDLVEDAEHAGADDEVCYAEEAELLLAALRRNFPDKVMMAGVEGDHDGGGLTRRTSCVVM
jgi:hypothetical protein